MKRVASGYSIFQRKDGVWVIAYQAKPGKWKQHRLAATTELKAEREGKKWLATHRAAGTLPGATKTLSELSEKWIKLRAASPKLATSTVRDNESQLKNHILPTLGSVRVGDLDQATLRKFVRELRDTMSSNALRNVMSTLSAFFEDCRAEGWVDATSNVVRQPAVQREMPEVRNERDEVIWIQQSAAQALVFNQRVPMDRRILYTVAFTSGLRSGELFGLQWAQVDLESEVPAISVVQALALKGDADKWIGMSDPKTHGSKRIVPLHRASILALNWWLMSGWEFWTGRKPTDVDHVFPSPRAAPWRPKSAKFFRRDLKATTLPTVTNEGNAIDFHSTRRSFLTWLAEADVPDRLRKRLAGHSGDSVTNTSYTGAGLRQLRDAVNVIPLEWCGNDPDDGTKQGVVRTLCGRTTNSAKGVVEASKTEPEQIDRDQAPVAQWIEQRFPKRQVGSPKVTETVRSSTLRKQSRCAGQRLESETDRADLERRAARFDGNREGRRTKRVAYQRVKDDELNAMFNHGVRIALGQTSVTQKEMPETFRLLLQEIVELQGR